MSLFLGIDIGSSTIKVAAWTADGSCEGVVKRPLPVRSAGVKVESDAHEIFENVESALVELSARLGPRRAAVRALGVTGYGNGLIRVRPRQRSAAGAWEVVGPAICSTDRRAEDYLRRALWRAAAERALGQRLYSGQTLVLGKMLSSEAERALFVKDWVAHCLDGELSWDPTDAQAGGLIPLDDACGDEGWGPAFPHSALRHSTATRGALKRSVAERVGLAAGIPVAAGCIDIAAAALGCGCTERGDLFAAAGTWTIDARLVHGPRPRVKLPAEANLLKHAVGDLYFVSVIGPTSGKAFERARELMDLGDTPEEVEAAARRADCDQPLRLGSPYFIPDFYAGAGGFVGLDASATRESVARSIYEGIAFAHRENFDRLMRVGSERPVRVAGGLARSTYWCGLLSETLEAKVVSHVDEVASLGAAMCAAVSVGEFKGLVEASKSMAGRAKTFEPQRSEVLEERFARWSERRNKQREDS